MTYSDILRSAADLIRTGGLTKNQLEDGTGAHCAVGAILARGSIGCWSELDRLADEMYPDRARPEGSWLAVPSLVNFNNHPDTTAEDVITVLEKAAIALEERVS